MRKPSRLAIRAVGMGCVIPLGKHLHPTLRCVAEDGGPHALRQARLTQEALLEYCWSFEVAR